MSVTEKLENALLFWNMCAPLRCPVLANASPPAAAVRQFGVAASSERTTDDAIRSMPIPVGWNGAGSLSP